MPVGMPLPADGPSPRWRALLAAMAVAAATPSVQAQSPESPDRARVVLVQTLAEEGAQPVESLATALRGQLGPNATLRIVPGRPDSRDRAARRRWGADVARRENALAAMWVEPGAAPDEMTLWLVEPREPEPRLRSMIAKEPDPFDRDRILAIAARTMLADVLDRTDSAAEPSGEATAASSEGRSREDGGDAPPPSSALRARPTAEPAVEPGPPAGPAPAPREPGVGLHVLSGPAVRLRRSGAAAAWHLALGIRPHRFLVVRAWLDLVREESPALLGSGAAVTRRRVPLGLAAGGHLVRGRWHLDAGPSVALVPAVLSGQGATATNGTAVALVVGAGATAAVEVADDLFLAIQASIAGKTADLRVGPAGSAATPGVEGILRLGIGLGRP